MVLRTHWVVVVAGSTLAFGIVGGCDKKAPSSLPAASAPAGSTYDWSGVQAAGPTEAMDAMGRICRKLDTQYKGEVATITLTFGADGVTDAQGVKYTVSAEEWKGICTFKSKDNGDLAARALPSNAMNYRDGLGVAKRRAYMFKRESGVQMTVTFVKEVSGESTG